MTTIIVLVALALLVVLLVLADRKHRRHGGAMSPGEAGRDKGSMYGPG
jgi:preprotein translocase subunit SecG